MTDGILIGAGSGGACPQNLNFKRANRHGLIAGATGTGETVTLQGIVGGFSAAGVPSFVADVKDDLAGLSMPGAASAKTHAPFAARAREIGFQGWSYAAAPVRLWDLFDEQGLPIRTTVSRWVRCCCSTSTIRRRCSATVRSARMNSPPVSASESIRPNHQPAGLSLSKPSLPFFFAKQEQGGPSTGPGQPVTSMALTLRTTV